MTDEDKQTLAEHIYGLLGFNVKYDFGHDTIEGYFGAPTDKRWYRVTIETCEDPEPEPSEVQASNKPSDGVRWTGWA